MTNGEPESPKTHYIWPLVLGLAVAIGMFIGKKLEPFDRPNTTTQGYRNLGKVEEILRYINARYVEDVDEAQLSDDAIMAIMKDLDPHSTYHTAEQRRRMMESMSSSFEGIGVEFLILDDTITILQILEGGPSEALGLQILDRITHVNDTLVAGVGITNTQVIQKLKGPSQTGVDVTIKRGNESIDYTIKRGRVKTSSIDVAMMLNENTGYIKIDNFSATTYEDFMQGMERMVKEEKMKDLVVDLRGNPGGYLRPAVQILNQFFSEKDKVLVYTEGVKSKRSDHKTNGRNFFDVENVALLIDEGSASASEIMAGAIQDWDRGVIIGRRSYGKGLVQEEYELQDGSAIRLTVSKYFTPSGRCIQKAYGDSLDYNSEYYDRYASGEVYSVDQVKINDTTRYMTAGGRIVYAGGGIIPDVFIPLDSTEFNSGFYAMREAINLDVVRFYEANPGLRKWTIEQFSEEFIVPDDRIRKVYESEKIPQMGISYRSVIDASRRYFKARLGRQLFRNEGFFQTWLEYDKEVEAALEALRDPSSILKKSPIQPSTHVE